MRNRIVPAAWLLVLLCLPAISLALGARQPLMDNRPKTSWPSIHTGELFERKTYERLDAAWLERVPTRKQAVQAHAQISLGVFEESPNPAVSVGRDGWLYYNEALQTCRAAKPTVDPGDAAEIAARTIIATGRRALIVEPADKVLIHPSKAPRYPRGVMRCVTALQQDLATRLTKIPGGVDFDAQLRRMEAAGQSTFLHHDSHWNYRGRLAYARLMLDFITPGLSRATGLHLGPWHDRHSDLYRQLGLPKTERDRAVLLQRAAPRPVPTGSTLLIGDSQTIETFTVPPTPGATPLSRQLPKGTVVCPHVERFIPGTCDDALRSASAIAIESVGRNLLVFEATCTRVVTLLAQGMRGAKGRYALLDGAASLSGNRVAFGPDGKAVLRIAPATGNVSPEARLVGIPVEALPPGTAINVIQRPTKGLPSPCATIQATQSDVFLILPIPAGRDASELVVQLNAPPGTTLGPPQEVALRDPRASAVERP
jgi:SGNH hydrolase-like domain, acetyltransferase AlgX